MSPVIAFASTKGGVGKSTVIAGVAHAAILDGITPLLIDADPNCSLQDIITPPDQSPIAPQLRYVKEADDMGLRKVVQAAKRDFVLIDTAGFGNKTAIEAMALSDIVVVPVQPSKLDVAATQRTAKHIQQVNEVRKQRKAPPLKALYLLTRTGRHTLADHFREDLAAAGYLVLDTEIPNSIEFPRATLFGETPLTSAPKSKSAQSLRDLWAELNHHLSPAV